MNNPALSPVLDPFSGVNPRHDLEQNRWLSGKLRKLDGLRDLFVKRRAWQHKTRWSLFAANRELRQAVDRLSIRGVIPLAGLIDVGLSLDASDDDISQYCETKSLECERIVNHHDGRFPGLRVLVLLDAVGIDPSCLFSGRDKSGAVVDRDWQARVSSASWWRRRVRVICARGAEAVCREAGYVSRHSGAYVSNHGFARWLSAQKRNRSVLESMEIIDQDTGECLPMVQAVDASTSNPEHRRGELMTRARGFEEVAEKLGYTAMFYTVTCPSRFHAFSGSRRNDNYDGSSPREASQYLTALWARCRAMLARRKIQFFGFRVAEPHHDGCPHWHLLVYVHESQKWPLTEILHGHAMEDSGDEPGADKHRFTAVQIEVDSGSPSGATGYIAKYISKNIDGYKVGDDLESETPADQSSLRVRAWASIWGIRQFQQIGGPSVSVWRELRRAANHPERVYVGDQFQAIIDAADVGDWALYVDLMGGAVAARCDRPLSLMYSDHYLSGAADKFGRYGDVLVRVLGVVSDRFDNLVVTRFKDWVTRRINDMRSSYGAACDAITGGNVGFTGPPIGGLLDLCQ